MGLFNHKKHDETIVDPNHPNKLSHNTHGIHGTAGLDNTNTMGGAGYNNHGTHGTSAGLANNNMGGAGYNNHATPAGGLMGHNNNNVNTGINHGQPGTGLTGTSHTHGTGAPGLAGTGAGLTHSGRMADVDPSYQQGAGGYPVGAGQGQIHNTMGGRDHGVGHGAGGIPPSSAVNNGSHSGGGGGKSMTGKVESAMGSLLGSESLKAKGAEKEREAASIKMQGQELAEAERLEKEALMRRERAVAHGAHPGNAHPQGHLSHGGVDPNSNSMGGNHGGY